MGSLTEQETVRTDGGSTPEAKKKAEAQPTNKGGQENNSWTGDEDRELLELQGAGNSWKDIASRIGKPKKVVTARFGQLKAAENKSAKPATGASENNRGATKTVHFAEAVEEPGNKGKPGTMSAAAHAAGASHKQGACPSFPTFAATGDRGVHALLARYAEELTKQSKDLEKIVYDDINSLALGEVCCDVLELAMTIGLTGTPQARLIARLEAHYEEQKWLSVASRIHELSGKRVEASALKAKWQADF